MKTNSSPENQGNGGAYPKLPVPVFEFRTWHLRSITLEASCCQQEHCCCRFGLLAVVITFEVLLMLRRIVVLDVVVAAVFACAASSYLACDDFYHRPFTGPAGFG